MKTNVLIFPAGTEIAFEILNALKYSKFIKLFGGTSVPCHAEFVYENYIDGFPFVDDENFIDYLNSVIEKYDIKYIYPAHDDAVVKLTEARDRINAVVIAADIDTVRICRSKNETYKYLKNEAYVPETYTDADEICDYPVFIKPSIGQGSLGAKKIESKDELLKELAKGTELSVCEYLSGNEYTVDCFTDKNGNLRVAKLRERQRIRNGIAVRSHIIDMPGEVKKISDNINGHFKFKGAWFFQMKKNSGGEFKLLEISPRIPGTMGLSRNLGINFPLLTLYTFMGYDVDIIDNGCDITLDRAFISRYKLDISYDTVYIDFDDTIICDDKVNVFLMAYLYQLKNKEKRIILITKHDYDIYESLNKHKICVDLFDEIIHIGRDDEKYRYITDKNSIFIDDSFAERMKIKEKCGIPVFDLDMIESLLDWRM